jgi:hypothetical protein
VTYVDSETNSSTLYKMPVSADTVDFLLLGEHIFHVSRF